MPPIVGGAAFVGGAGVTWAVAADSTAVPGPPAFEAISCTRTYWPMSEAVGV